MRLPLTRTTPLLALVAALALVFGVTLAASPAAFAHDQLLSSDPAAGSELEVAPEALTLTFSDAVQEIGSSAKLTDGSTEHAVSLEFEQETVRVLPQEPLPSGEYTLEWRVTSSDGHPIEGTSANGKAIDFVVATDSAAESTADAASASGEPEEQPSLISAPEESSSAAPASSAEAVGAEHEDAGHDAGDTASEGVSPWLVIVITLGAIAAAGLVFVVMYRKAKDSLHK